MSASWQACSNSSRNSEPPWRERIVPEGRPETVWHDYTPAARSNRTELFHTRPLREADAHVVRLHQLPRFLRLHPVTPAFGKTAAGAWVLPGHSKDTGSTRPSRTSLATMRPTVLSLNVQPRSRTRTRQACACPITDYECAGATPAVPAASSMTDTPYEAHEAHSPVPSDPHGSVSTSSPRPAPLPERCLTTTLPA